MNVSQKNPGGYQIIDFNVGDATVGNYYDFPAELKEKLLSPKEIILRVISGESSDIYSGVYKQTTFYPNDANITFSCVLDESPDLLLCTIRFFLATDTYEVTITSYPEE